ncbi:MAG: hypothetical protein AAB955_03510 [Patescibacteria group bacterium]
MMDLFRRYQTIILFIVAVAFIFLGYKAFFAPAEDPAVLTVSEEASGPDQELIALLFELRAIQLDPAIFADPIFQSLSDFSLELVPEPTGRQNPFAPLGGTE